MITRHQGSLKYLQFENLQDYPLVQGIFTRQGGVSPPPWSSLNIGGTVADQPERVLENKQRLLAAVGFEPQETYEVWQVHSAKVVKAEAPLKSFQGIQKADAIITDQPGLLLLMRFADCVPIFLYDPVHRAAGMVHAGWKGTASRAASTAVRAMRDHFGTVPEDVLAGIGPSIGPDHYQIGKEVVEAYESSFGNRAAELYEEEDGLVKLNLWAANELDLNEVGVEQVEVAGICTACHLDDWYSHRRERGETGRFGAVLGLRDTENNG